MDDDSLVSGSQTPREETRRVFERAAQLVPRCIGRFQLLREIGRGGMGRVYLTRDRERGELVALKTTAWGDLANDTERHLFRTEVEAVRRLQGHPGIVPLYASGEDEGWLYYAMARIDGATLAERSEDFREPDAAARLLLAVAQAVAHAHRNAVLHRDLSPRNVLIDGEQHAYVTDFGVAKLLGESDFTPTDAVVGVVRYMAPEQAGGHAREATTASDVYSLGAILYELLAGEPPYGGTHGRVLEKLIDPRVEPVPLSQRAPWVDADLEAICSKCLEKNPADRYASAAELAADLERRVQGEPVTARPASGWRQIVRFTRRHRRASLAIACAAALLGGVLGTLSASVGAQEEQLRQSTLAMMRYAVQYHAGAMLNELRERAERVERIAADPVVVELAATPRFAVAPELRAFQEGRFDLVAVLDAEGRMAALYPQAQYPILKRDYAWRDYFGRVRERVLSGVTDAYVARSFLSENDGLYKFAITAPIFREGRWVGVVLATVLTDAALGPFKMIERDERRYLGVLLGPLDRSRELARAGAPLPDDYLALIHGGLRPGHGVPVQPPLARRLKELTAVRSDARSQLELAEGQDLVLDDYRDPVLDGEVRWLATFAPVGGTGYVIGMQTRHDAAVQPSVRLRHTLAQLISAVTIAALISLAAAIGIALLPHWRGTIAQWRRGQRRWTQRGEPAAAAADE